MLRYFLFFLCIVSISDTFHFSMTPVEFIQGEIDNAKKKLQEFLDLEYIGAMYNFTQVTMVNFNELTEKQQVAVCDTLNVMNNIDMNKGIVLKFLELVTFFSKGCAKIEDHVTMTEEQPATLQPI